jgi:protein XRP2
MFVTFYTFSNRSGETLTKSPGQVSGQPFTLEDLTDCTVRICDHSETVQVDRLTRCRVFIGACCESVFLRNCTDCTFTLACKQLRTRDCANCVVFLYSKTDPIIEASHTMKFAPFNGSYPGLDSHMRSANLEPRYNHWKRIFDFSADSVSLPRPHWSFLGEFVCAGGWGGVGWGGRRKCSG